MKEKQLIWSDGVFNWCIHICTEDGSTPYNGLYGEAPPKGVPLSGFRRMKGQRFHSLKYMKGLHNLSLRSERAIGRILWPWASCENFLVLWLIHSLKTVSMASRNIVMKKQYTLFWISFAVVFGLLVLVSLHFGWFDLFSCDPTFTTSRIFVHGFCS